MFSSRRILLAVALMTGLFSSSSPRLAGASITISCTRSDSLGTVIRSWTITKRSQAIAVNDRLIGCVQHHPSWGAPTVSIKDTLGNPLVINATLLTLASSPSDTVAAHPLGKLTFPWEGYRTNAIPTGGTTVANYVVTYTWRAAAQGTYSGGGEFSSRSSTTADEEYTFIPVFSVPALNTIGIVVVALLLAMGGMWALARRKRTAVGVA